jgi:serine/threonine-protein kinase
MPHAALKAALSDPSLWPQLNAHIDHALEMGPEERRRWLTGLMATEPAVAELLTRMLEQETVTHLDELLSGSAPKSILAALACEVRAGQRIGAYTLERLIGYGGMGEVWLAVRSDGQYEGRCAIKFLDGFATQPWQAERFRHEGRVLARLSDPNIARLLDAGVTAEGRQYLLLEYVDGECIDAYCDSRGLSTEARVGLFLDVVEAIAHAHSNLIVHQDLKPSNVLVTREGTVKLLDFGIAALLNADTEPNGTVEARVERRALTPEYAAPEQLVGGPASTVTDIYQLGLLLYVLLVGEHPRKLTGTRGERIKTALETRIPRASELASPTRGRELRGDLDAILEMCLHVEQRQRYPTAQALYDDLLRHLNHEPVAVRRGQALYQLARFMRRHRVGVLGSALAAASLAVALVFAFVQARVAASERDRAVALVARNEAVTQFMGTVLVEAAASARPVSVSDLLARSEKLALDDTSGNRENRAAVLKLLSDHYHGLGDFGMAERLVRDALRVLGDSPNQSLRSELTCGLAYVLSTTGQMDAALQMISRELANPPADIASRVSCLHDRAVMATSYGDPANALRYASEALTALQSSPRKTADIEAGFLLNVADAHRIQGDAHEASDYYARAMSKLTEAGLTHGMTAITLRNNWATASFSAGVPKRALQLTDEALRDLSARDPEAPRPAYLILNRARALDLIGRWREALPAYESCLQLATDSKARYWQLYCRLGQADMERELGDIDAAEKHVADAAMLLGSAEPPDSIPSIRVAVGRGRVDLARDRLAEARIEFSRALESQRSTQTMIEAHLGIAEAELRAGDATAAVADARAALDVATAQQGGLPYSQQTGLAWLMLGRGTQKLGDSASARRAFEAAVAHLSNTVDGAHPALVEAIQRSDR